MIPSNEPMRNDPAEAKINALLPELSKALATGLHDIEPGFEVLGQTLQTVYGDSETLTKGIMASVDTMTGKSDTSLLHHIGKAVNDSLSVLSGCSESIAGSLENITACSGYLTTLCTVCEKIKKNAGFLNIIGLNLSVEGGRTHETTEMFRDFGDEIKRLAGNMSQISTTIYENSDQIQKKQLIVQIDISDSIKTFDTLSESTKHAIQRTTEELKTIGHLASQTLEKAGNHSREISSIVGGIVMSIQFHDIARQQVEHIISALEDLVSTFSPAGESPPETWEKDDSQKGHIYSILTLQAAQLKQVINEAQKIYKKTLDAFGQIGNEVDQLMENVAVSRSTNLEDANLEQRFDEFQENIETLRKLLTQGNELELSIEKTMERSSSGVATLFKFTDQVSNINIDLQYKAINAMIMTNKLGNKGATLEVLSSSVRDLSKDSNQRINEVLTIIQSITDLSKKEAQAVDDPPKNRENNDAFRMTLDESVSRISTTFEDYRQHCARAEEISREIMGAIEETKRHLHFIPQWIQGCEQIRETIDKLLEELHSWKTLANTLPEDAKENISQRYTMESERRIHEALSASNEGSENESFFSETDDSETMDEDDDLDDNIELF